MEKDKQRFLKALMKNNGILDELALGEELGFKSKYTEVIIQELLKEGKIEFQSFGLCSYRVKE